MPAANSISFEVYIVQAVDDDAPICAAISYEVEA